MTPIQQPNRASSDAWAMPHSKGKASQWPAFTPAQPSPTGPISHTNRIERYTKLAIPTRQGRATTTAHYGRYLPCHLARELRV